MKQRTGVKRVMILGLCAMTVSGMMLVSGCGSSATGFPYDAYNLDDYITVGECKGMEVDGYTIEVSDSEVHAAIDKALEGATADMKLKKGDQVQAADTINIDYVGRIDGKKFEGGSAEGYDLTIGSGAFIEGFESGLIGKKVGDTKVKVKVTFPEDYAAPEVAGKDAVFTVTINSGTRPKIPEYDDAFAKTQGDYNNTEEYEKAIRKQLRDQKEAEAIEDQKMALWDKVVSKSDVREYPQDEVDNYMKANDKMMDATAKESGLTREEILSKYGFKDEKSFKVSNEESSKLRVKQELIVAKIAEREGISYTNEEKEAMINEFLAQGYDEGTMELQTGRSMDQYVCIQLLYDKVLDFILDQAKVK